MDPQTARIDRSGRLVLPAPIRSQLELREGDEVVFVGAGPHAVTLIPSKDRVRRAQAIIREHRTRSGSAVENLIAQRRQDAAREQRELDKQSEPRRP